MTFGESIATCLNKYADFTGRGRRSEYWWFFVFTGLVNTASYLLFPDVLGLFIALALILPSLAASIRRLHDTGKSGWYIFISVIPLVGGIILIVFLATDSDPAPNAYGPSPKTGLV